jgi:indolepyruvate ferredoxin oxidoreductase
VSVEMNLLAFRWGRMAVVDRAQVEAAVVQATTRVAEQPAALSAVAQALVDRVGATGELRRLLEIRVPELIAYQNAAYAGEYVDFVARVAQVEAERAPGQRGLAEAAARYLHKLMAYKDEYEVARLHLDAAVQAQLQSKFGPKIRTYWHLHPPLLRALGLKKKIRLGSWFAPAFHLLAAMKGLRGTRLDVFGYAGIRQVERALIEEYRQHLETAMVRLSPVTHDLAVKLAELPDEIRGYEHVKMENVERFRDRAQQLIAQIN